jgi:hypothetical protein
MHLASTCSSVWECGANRVFLTEIFFMFSDCFNVLMLKIIFKKIKKNYFNTFLTKKYFKLSLLPQFQTYGVQFSVFQARTTWSLKNTSSKNLAPFAFGC